MNQLERIQTMESILDQSTKIIKQLNQLLDQFEDNQADMKKLIDYYESDLFLCDFNDDETGKIPAIKKGVLSEDAVYNLLYTHRELLLRLLKISANYLE